MFLIVAAAACSEQPSIAQVTSNWVGTWSAAADALPMSSGNQTAAATTYRNIVHTTIAGGTLRVKLTNEMGLDKLAIGEVSIALNGGAGSVLPGTQLPVTFGGQPSVTIPAGTIAISDPITMTIPAFADLAISIYVPQQTVRTWTFHQVANASNYTAPGDQASASAMTGGTQITSWYLLKGIDVQAPGAVAVVTIGDSITDGQGSTLDANHRWPDVLASNLAGTGGTPISVLEAGIAGNQILGSSAAGGLNALARLDRDALTQSGAKYLIVLEGTNDIFKPTTPAAQTGDITSGLSQIVSRAHELGFTVYGATITPSSRLTSAEQIERTAVNQWIRTSGVFDAVLDFDLVVQNPAKPQSLLPQYDSGDHIHPNDAGYNAMASSIPMSLFQSVTSSRVR